MSALNMTCNTEGAATATPQPQLYTQKEVIEHFEALLPALDLKDEIAELGYGLNSFFNKSRSLNEFNAMCTVLWRLALNSSFPHESEKFFEDFLANSPLLGKGKKREKFVARVRIYLELFSEKRAEDFTPVAAYMAENLSSDTTNRKALHLKLSLTMRKLYQLIFDHLI